MSNMIPRMAHLLKGSTAIKAVIFTPLALFASNEVGAWYDPSDMSTMFQDAAGTTPVTAVEQPVSLLLDKSKSLALGSELVSNGDFSNGTTGWTESAVGALSVSSGQATVINNTAGTKYAYQSFSTVVGRLYLVTFDVISTAGGATQGRVSAGNSPSNEGAGAATFNVGTRQLIIYPQTTTTFVRFGPAGTGINFAATFDNISVKEIAGNHAYTPSTATASRPVLSARYNLLTKTEQFDDAVWSKATATITPDTTVSPAGTTTADTLAVTNSVGQLKIATSPILAAGSYTQELSFRRGNVDWVVFYTSDAGANYAAAWVNTATGALGTVVAAGNFSAVTATVTAQANSFYRLRLNFTKPATAASDTFVVRPVNGDNSFTATAGNSVIVWGADLRVANDGVALPAYQRVNTSTDYDTTNFPMYLRFDGSDDYMLTGTITPGTDKAQVFAGVRKLSDAAAGTIVESSSSSDTQNGSFMLNARTGNSQGVNNFGYNIRGTATAYRTAEGFAAPITVVSFASLDASASTVNSSANLRMNGNTSFTVSNFGSAPSGTAFLAYPIYIGRRAGTSFPFNGRLFGLVVRFGANLTDTQITNTETWMNGKTKAY